MNKIAIGVVFGGCSTEYEVSLSSAAAVIEHLDKEKYDVIMIGITRDGRWFRYNGEIEDIREDRWNMHNSCIPAFLSPSTDTKGLIELVHTEYRITALDVVFPVLHGKNGEDGTMQGLLELSGLPFVGCDTLSSAVCMDKAVAKSLVEAAGIEVPPSATLFAGGSAAEAASAAADKLGFPLYVKPSRSGSSIGITKAYTMESLMAGVDDAFSHDNKVVIEQHIDGIEVGCAILGQAKRPFIGAIDEIALTGEFFDHEEKYSLETAAIHLPARLDADMTNQVKELSLRIYSALGCSGFARVDMFLTRDGRLLFNEVNTIPGFTAHSRYPNMMKHAGVAFPELLDRLIESAINEVSS